MAETIRRGLLFGVAAAGIFVFGTVMAILGTLFGLPELRARLGINLAQQGNVFLLLYLGIFLATLVAGPVIDAIGNKVILVVSSALVASAMVGFAYAHSLGGVALPAVLLGLGGGGLNTSTNVLVSDLFGEKRGPMLNVLGIFYGVGALCIPLFAAVIAGHFTIAQMLILCAGLAGICALLFLAVKFPSASGAQSISWREALRVVRYPGVLVLGFLLFCQSGNEASIAGWTSTYVGATGLGVRTATLILAVYWASLMLGRLITSQLLKVVGKAEWVLASGIGAMAGAGICLATRAERTLLVGAVVLGLSYAGVFPTVLAIAGDRYRNMAGTVFGLLFAMALVGGMTFPWAVGQISQAVGVRFGLLVPLAGAAGIFVVAILTMQRQKRARGL